MTLDLERLKKLHAVYMSKEPGGLGFIAAIEVEFPALVAEIESLRMQVAKMRKDHADEIRQLARDAREDMRDAVAHDRSEREQEGW